MSQCPDFTHLLVLPRLRVQNANAISGPLTHGFPAMTAFLGLMWALQRKAGKSGIGGLQFRAVGVVCHDHQEQVGDGYVKAFNLTRNPIGRDGNTAAIVEEGRIHLNISLIFAVDAPHLGADAQADMQLAQALHDVLCTMRIAGGTVVPSHAYRRPRFVAMTGDADGQRLEFRKAMLRLLPGFALVARDDLLAAEHERLKADDPQATVLDAWLKRSRWNHRYDHEANAWTHDRGKGSGWIVPIPVGYAALTDLQAPGTVTNARDATTPFRFVESLQSLGEWLGPHRLAWPQQLLWYADTDPASGLYRCRNDYVTADTPVDEIDWSLY